MKNSVLGKPILTDEHVFIGGKTGTGKTELAKNYLSQFPRVAMLDTKGDTLKTIKKGLSPWPQVDPKDLTVITNVESLRDVTTRHLIYVPAMEELTIFHYDEFFRWCYFQEDITVWVDECMNVSPSSQVIPEYYKGILTRGRTRNVSVWSLTQRPKGIHPLIMSQCTHFFAFNLRLDQDRDKMAEVTGVPEFYNNPGGYNFWYFRDDWDAAVKAKLVLKGGE